MMTGEKLFIEVGHQQKVDSANNLWLDIASLVGAAKQDNLQGIPQALDMWCWQRVLISKHLTVPVMILSGRRGCQAAMLRGVTTKTIFRMLTLMNSELSSMKTLTMRSLLAF